MDLQRRLFRGFAQAGGDLMDDAQMEDLLRRIEAALLLLPGAVRDATELAWRYGHSTHGQLARTLSALEGRRVTPSAARQRVSRGARVLQRTILEMLSSTARHPTLVLMRPRKRISRASER